LFWNPPTGPGYYSFLDFLTGKYRESPPPYPYTFFALSSLSFFNADWRFVDSPGYDPDFLEKLKRIHVGDNWLLNTGGQAWFRYQNEYNARLGQINNHDVLYRVREYLDVWYQDRFRFFIEGIYADSLGQVVKPVATDIDRGDFQNLFIEARLGTIDDKGVFARVGRQEFTLGSQRLIGTSDWGNTRRTWDGARLFRDSDSLDVNLFWMQPVIPNPEGFSSVDDKQNFAGAYVTYRPTPGMTFDGYDLVLQNTRVMVQQGIIRGPLTINTLGGRTVGDIDNRWLWESEGCIQLGEDAHQPVLAGMYSGCLGYHFKNLPWDPTFWAVYNFESGDNDPNHGHFRTFNQLFPYIHYYEGWVDAVGRQNQRDLNLRCYLYPQNWITIWLQYHHYWLAEPRDALYDIAGNAYRRDPSGQDGTDVGQKAEVLMNFHMTLRSDLLVGYSYLWGGEFLQKTAGPNAAVNSSIFYFGYSLRW
jgi:hypothetical protein